MKPLTDERIMAYVDGELTSTEAQKIRKAIDQDPDALERMAIFKESATMLQGVYDAPLNEAVPQQLINTIQQNRPNKTGGRIKDFLTVLFRLPQWSPAYGMALTITLILGISTGYLVSRWTSVSPRPNLAYFAGPDLGQGLETAISGQTFAIADGAAKVTPIATFRGPLNRYCRQYEIQSMGPENDFSRGIACRTSSGQWQTIVHLKTMPVDQTAEKSEDYMPAGQDDIFEDIVKNTMTAPPLTLDQETALIHHTWR